MKHTDWELENIYQQGPKHFSNASRQRLAKDGLLTVQRRVPYRYSDGNTGHCSLYDISDAGRKHLFTEVRREWTGNEILALMNESKNWSNG